MARHKANHAQLVYAPDAETADKALIAKAAMFARSESWMARRELLVGAGARRCMDPTAAHRNGYVAVCVGAVLQMLPKRTTRRVLKQIALFAEQFFGAAL